MKRLLLDISHIAKTTMFAALKGEQAFLVGEEKIPHHADAFEIFLIALKACLRNLNMTPQQIVICKDGANCKAFRRQFIPEYCKREPRPPQFGEQYRLLEDKICDMLMKHGALVVSKAGVEADDIIAALAKVTDSVIWSGDQDLLATGKPQYYQGSLKEEKFPGIPPQGITLYKTLVGDTSDNLPGVKGFGEGAFLKMVEKFGLDSIDDLLEMLEAEDLSTLEAYASEFKPFRLILDQAETAINTYKCVKFYHPGWDLDFQARYPEGTEYLPSMTQELVTADNFEKAKAELAKDIKEAVVVALDIETDVCQQSREWSINAQSDSDKEPPVDIIGSELCGFSITAGNRTRYFSVDHKDTENITLKQAEQILNMLPTDKPIAVHNTNFELTVLRNHFELKFDRGWLPSNTFDTRILSGYVSENEKPNLKHQSKLRLKYDQTTYKEVLGDRSGMRELTGSEVLHYGCDDSIVTAQLYSLYELICKYEGSWDGYEKVDQLASFMYAESFLNGVKFDMDKLALLHKESQEKYASIRAKIDEFLINLTWEETEAQPITIEMMRAMREGAEPPPIITRTRYWPGCEFIAPEKESVAEVKRLYKIWKGSELSTTSRSVGKVLAEIGVEFGELVELARKNFKPTPEFNLRSPKQMGELLYEVLRYPVRLRNKVTDIQRSKGQREGNPSTNEDAVAHSIIYDATPEEKEFLENILKAKECLTEEGLYYSAYPRLVHWKTGRVHPNPGQALAATGRSTPSRPNLTQMSKEGRIREVVVGDDDYFILSMDMDSQELVQIAEQSGDPDMIACYSGEVRKDLHSLTAASIYRLKYGDISYEEFVKVIKDDTHEKHSEFTKIRKLAKVCNFQDAYLGTAQSLSIKLRVPLEEAEVMLDAKHKAFPGVTKWQEDTIELIRQRGYSVEPMGRRRHLVLENNWKDNHTLRGGLNHTIQGAASSQIKCILSEMWQRQLLEWYKHTVYFLFSVHDEVVWAVHKDDMLQAVKNLHPVMMRQYADFKLQFKSSIAIGKSFGELKELGSVVDEGKILEAISV